MSRTLKKMFGDARIEDQWLPYFCVATNLSRATIAVHQQGSLAFTVGTSIAVPGLAPPLIQNGDFLVDGGLLENVPVGVMRRVSQGTRVHRGREQARRVHDDARAVPRAIGMARAARADRTRRQARDACRACTSCCGARRCSTACIARRRCGDVGRLHPSRASTTSRSSSGKEMDRAIDAGYRAAVEALAPGAEVSRSLRLVEITLAIELPRDRIGDDAEVAAIGDLRRA